MTNTFEQLKDELRVLYPDITDIELNEMTGRLIDFYTMAVKIIYQTVKPEEADPSLTDINDS